jgi:bacterioferritin (cytochrome b1)
VSTTSQSLQAPTSGREPLDAVEVVRRLNDVLPLQYRSMLQFTIAAASLTGLQCQAAAEKLEEFAAAELADTHRLVMKVVALAGSPATQVAGLRHEENPRQMLTQIVESEEQAIEAIVEAIPPTGTEGRGEAVEHLIEHVLYRKQEQVDWLLRALTT